MAAKAVLAICASALFVQSAYSACMGAGIASPFVGAPFAAGGCAGAPFAGFGYGAFDGFGYGGFDGIGAGCGLASTGGGLAATSASPIPPVGVSVLSENVYEGGLAVGGNLPFLGTIGLEGILPTAGAGAVSYGCGAGPCAIAAEEGPIATGIAPSVGFGPGFAGYGAGYAGYGAGLAGYGAGYAGYGAGLAGYGAGFSGYGAGLGYGGFGYGLGAGCGGIY